MRERQIHVVGGGIAGLVAAVTAAEAGAPVVLHEAARSLGGRADGGTGNPGINLGPHVAFADGALVRWLRSQAIDVDLRRAPPMGARMLDDHGLRLPFADLRPLLPTVVRREAPVDEPFRDWSDHSFGTTASDLMCRISGLYTFHHDPGTLSARFVWERYRRVVLGADRVRWVAGGWPVMIEAIARRAAERGVEIRLESAVSAGALPAGPTVVATTLPAASRLLGRRLRWSGTRTAIVDVRARPQRRSSDRRRMGAPRASWPTIVADIRSDLTTCCMVERETGIEPGLLGDDDELFQAQLGVGTGVTKAEAVARIESALDQSVSGWREAVVWRRDLVLAGATGAVDLPGTTWRDRPAVGQGDDVFIAGDMTAAPGMLSEVAVNSGILAARAALAARHRRSFAVGWPAAELSPARRLAVLAAVLPDARLRPAASVELEPVDETGPGYRIHLRRGAVSGVVGTGADGVAITTARVGRHRLGLARRR